MALSLPSGTRNALADTAVDRLDAGAGPGVFRIYTGSKPASANDAASGTLLATVTLADPAFGSATAGVATLTDPAVVQGVADGTAGWFRALDSNSNTVFDGTVTASGGGGDLTLNTTTISTGVDVDITGGTVTMPA